MPDRDPRYRADLRARAARMYRDGSTLEEIAQALGVNKARAYILALEGGAKMRDRGPADD